MPIVDFDLSDRVAVVNGGSRGIGESIGRAFAERGAIVVLSSRKQEALDEVAASIRDSGGRAVGIACHGGRPDEIEALFRRVDAEFGRLDIHVNNAATNPFFGAAMEIPLPAFDKTLEVNLRGYFLMTQQAARLMEKTGGGSIINISSVTGLRPGRNEAAYAMSKAGVINMTRSFAKELGPKGIRVNCIAPGLVETHFSAVLLDTEKKRAAVARLNALGRPAQPDEIAGAAVFFASDAGSFATGATLVVDGGETA